MGIEWNGEGLPPVNVECEWIGGGVAHGDWGLVIVRAYSGDYAWIEKLYDNSMHTVRSPAFFRKPETPQQRKDRERLEAAYDLYCIMCGIEGYAKFDLTDFSKTKKDSAVWLAIADKTNYRK